MKIITSHDI
jgi:hypothetical protein